MINSVLKTCAQRLSPTFRILVKFICTTEVLQILATVLNSTVAHLEVSFDEKMAKISSITLEHTASPIALQQLFPYGIAHVVIQ